MTGAARSPLAPTRPRRRAVVPGLVSFLLHAAILAVLILRWPGFAGVVAPPDKLATVQLVMVEQKGADKTSVAPTPRPTPPTPQTPPAPAPQTRPHSAPPAPAPPASAPPPQQTAPTPAPQARPAPEKPVLAKRAAKTPTHRSPDKPAPQAAPQQAPVQMNLGGNNPDTNTIVTGGQVVPASPDAAYTNRQPAYPIAAARRGEQGAVLLEIHVRPDGSAGAVEVSQSSGYPALDQAAVNAVRTWHFLPALRGGQPVESSFPFRVVFRLN